MNQVFLGIDYGTQRVGLAIAAAGIALPFVVVPTTEALARIGIIVRERHVTDIIVGMAYHLDGRRSVQVDRTEAFIASLRITVGVDVRIHTMDERLSTADARLGMEEAGVGFSRRKAVVDDMAAAIILQSYLDER